MLAISEPVGKTVAGAGATNDRRKSMEHEPASFLPCEISCWLVLFPMFAGTYPPQPCEGPFPPAGDSNKVKFGHVSTLRLASAAQLSLPFFKCRRYQLHIFLIVADGRDRIARNWVYKDP